jgi:GT2 family glycosyltransferase
VWLLNNDIVIEPGALQSLMQTLAGELRAAAVAPAMLSYTDPDVVLNAGASVNVWRGRISPRYARTSRADLPRKPFTTDSLEASAILIRTAALRDVGRLDEGFFMYWEDAEWSYRARSAGWSLLVDPRAGVRHLESESSTPLSRTRFMLRNRWRFVRMCGSRIQIAVFTAYFLGLWIPAYLGARLIPEYGIRLALTAALRAIAWNLGDMIRNRALRLCPARNEESIADDCS